MKWRSRLLLLAAPAGVALVFASQAYIGFRTRGVSIPFVSFLLLELCHWYLWAIAAPVVWSLPRRWPLRSGARLKNAVRYVLTAVPVVIWVIGGNLTAYLVIVNLPIFDGWYPGFDRSLRTSALIFLALYVHVELLVYAAILAVSHAVHAQAELQARERDTMRLSSELASARLQVLTAQLQPHFLFNALHTIGSLILQRKNDRAMEILAELGELLRITLDRRSAELITLRDEIAHLTRYLRIEEARFADRLTVHWNVDPATLDALVPPLLLQPIVENALKHGVAKRTGQTTIEIAATSVADQLRVSVYNDGPLLPGEWRLDTAAGYGLRNVHERLLTRSAKCRLQLQNVDNQGVRATIEMPMLRAREEATV
jgi:two-component system, LytTR family, sensor kinase